MDHPLPPSKIFVSFHLTMFDTSTKAELSEDNCGFMFVLNTALLIFHQFLVFYSNILAINLKGISPGCIPC